MNVMCYYLRTIKGEGKIASQVAHAVLGLNLKEPPHKIIVLKASKTILEAWEGVEGVYVQRDLGYTQLEPDTLTAVAYVTDEEK